MLLLALLATDNILEAGGSLLKKVNQA